MRCEAFVVAAAAAASLQCVGCEAVCIRGSSIAFFFPSKKSTLTHTSHHCCYCCCLLILTSNFNIEGSFYFLPANMCACVCLYVYAFGYERFRSLTRSIIPTLYSQTKAHVECSRVSILSRHCIATHWRKLLELGQLRSSLFLIIAATVWWRLRWQRYLSVILCH